MPLESLAPYFRGARFALLAVKRRHGKDDPDLEKDIDRYVAMVDRYSEAAVATFKLKKAESEGQ